MSKSAESDRSGPEAGTQTPAPGGAGFTGSAGQGATGVAAPSAALRERVLAHAAAHESPTRAAVLRESVGLGVGSWLVSLSAFLLAGGARVTGRPWSLVLGTTIGTACASAALFWFAFSRGRSSLHRA